MKLKLMMEDWHAAILSPSSVVDLVWHDHILDVEHYVQACQSYAGHLIGHNPNGALDANARATRIETTLRHLHYAAFQDDSVDAEIWSFGAYFEFTQVHPNASSEEGSEETMSLSSSTKANRMDPFLSMFAQKIKTPVESLAFWYLNSKVSPDDTAETLDCSQSRYRFPIQVTRVNRRRCRDDDPRLTIRFRDQTGEYMHLKVKNDTQMYKVFSSYATRKGVSTNAFRFLLDGEVVRPWHTPRMLLLVDQDQIDVMLEQSGC